MVCGAGGRFLSRLTFCPAHASYLHPQASDQQQIMLRLDVLCVASQTELMTDPLFKPKGPQIS